MIWGLYYGVLLLLEKLVNGKALSRLPSVLQHVSCMLAVMIGWYIFSFNEISGGISYLGAMFGAGGSFLNNGTVYVLYSNVVLLIALILGSTTMPVRAARAVMDRFRESGTACVILKSVFIVVVFLMSIAYLVSASYNPFLYFRF